VNVRAASGFLLENQALLALQAPKQVLEAKNLVKFLGESTALEGIPFVVGMGEWLGLPGVNGAEKNVTR